MFGGQRIVRHDDVRADPLYGDYVPYGMPSQLPIASYLAAPVVLRGEVLGGLFLGHPDPGVFSARDERFLIGIAAQAAIAMDNARLYAAARKARADAEVASGAKDELLSIVSHELRTPLSSIMGWAAVLRQGKLSPERSAHALETIERSCRVQGELIEDLLDVSRIVTGRLRLDVELLDLRSLVELALDAAKPDAAAKGLSLLLTIAQRVPVRGDATRLQQVVSNLVGNAIKFSPMGGRVFVTLAVKGDLAELTVRDEGEGIAAEFLPHVFEPFRQANDVRKRKGGGLGLGLTIVKNLVESHGGEVRVTSEGVGRGAEFAVSLALAASPEPGSIARDVTAPAESLAVEIAAASPRPDGHPV
jgi:signal transduction histidine kinase